MCTIMHGREAHGADGPVGAGAHSQASRLQLSEVGPQRPSHSLAAASAPLEDMHTYWVVCTPWPHVTEHEVSTLTQL